MPIIPETPDQVRLAGQPSEVAPGSPVAILALFSEIVRERFRAGNGLNWIYDENLTGAPTEAATVANPRKIMITPSYSKNAEARNYRPAIYVDRSSIQPEKVVLGNVAGKYIPHGTTGYYAQASFQIDIEIVSSTKGESATLADTVWFYLTANRDIIRSSLGLRDIALPQLGRTEPANKDRTEWVTHVTLGVQMTLRWLTKPLSPKIRDIVTKLLDKDGNLIGTYLVD